MTTAVEMHDAIKSAYEALDVNVFRKGWTPGFQHIKYCRYCHYSESHGHGSDCVLIQLKNICEKGMPP